MTLDDEIAKSIRKLNRLIAREWRTVTPELKRYIKQGNYSAERYLRGRAIDMQRQHLRDWMEWRLTKPPFMTKENGFYVRHQITPANVHLLRPQ